jgi:hypothetical protein
MGVDEQTGLGVEELSSPLQSHDGMSGSADVTQMPSQAHPHPASTVGQVHTESTHCCSS